MNKQKKHAPDKKDVEAYIPLYHYYIPIFGGCFPTDSFANGNVALYPLFGIWFRLISWTFLNPSPTKEFTIFHHCYWVTLFKAVILSTSSPSTSIMNVCTIRLQRSIIPSWFLYRSHHYTIVLSYVFHDLFCLIEINQTEVHVHFPDHIYI